MVHVQLPYSTFQQCFDAFVFRDLQRRGKPERENHGKKQHQ
jgi:hypothetical protein